MRVAAVRDNVLGSAGLQETKGFSIAANAHAFKALSSGLYSDKVRAVIREISCNAVDAHIAGGCSDRPVRVKIPNELDDQFYIQDWGPGLSHEHVMGLYTQYFNSTKQDSNDMTGAFGLGSKSPFSYTSQFSVVSTHGGVKRTYALFIANNGAPNVSLMAEEAPDADWASGLRVGFAVKPQDAGEFAAKAQDVLRWFRVTPEMRGVRPVERETYTFECPEYGLRKGAPRGEVMALMGNVAYPVKLDALGVTGPNNEESSKKLINYSTVMPGLVLFVPIGSVQVTLSREHLEYDPESIKTLKQQLKLAAKRSARDMIAALEVAASGTWPDLCRAREKIDVMMGGSTWHFKPMCEALGVEATVMEKLGKFVERSNIAIPYKLVTASTVYVVKPGRSSASVFTKDTYNGQVLALKPGTAVLAGDAPRAQSRAKRAVAEKKFEQVLVVTKPSKNKAILLSSVVDEAKAVALEMGGIEVLDLADYPPYDLAALNKLRQRKKKGWVPTLPAGVTFPTYGLDDKVEDLELGDPKMWKCLFACFLEKKRWSSTSEWMRVYDTTAENDDKVEWAVWEIIWRNFCAVQAAAQLTDAPDRWVKLTAHDIRQIALPKLSWGNAYDAVKDYLKRPELQTALRKGIKKKYLAAPQYSSHIKGWVTGLAWYCGDQPQRQDIRLRLDKLGLWDTIDGMIKARDAKLGDVNLPPAVDSYRWLTSRFQINDELAKDVSLAMTTEDADATFAARFPRANFITAVHLFANNPKQAPEAIDFVLSKEK